MNDAFAASPDPSRDGSLTSLVQALRNRLWVVIAVVVLVVGVAVLVSALREPSYEASADLIVTPVSADDPSFLAIPVLRESNDPSRTIQTAASVIKSPQIAAEAARRIGGGIDGSAVSDAITIEPLGASNLVSVTAQASSPQQAQKLASAYARAALDFRDQLVRTRVDAALAGITATDPTAQARRVQLGIVRKVGDPTIGLAQDARVPTAPIGASKALTLAVALIAGLILGGLAALLMERVDRRVGDRSELIAEIPIPVLARVPPLPRGRRGLDVPPAVREAFRTLQIQLDMRRGNGCRSVMLTSASSGDGKTTAVLNLAFALVGAGHRVIVIDFDLRKPDLERQLGLEASRGLVTLLGSETPLAELLHAAPRLAPLRVVPAAGQPGDVALLPVLARRLDAILAEAEQLADYVIMDTAPLGEVGDALAIVEHADDVLLVGRPGWTDQRALEVMAGLLERSSVIPTGWIISGDEVAPPSYYFDPEEPAGGSSRRGKSGTA
ncbi:Wzz/FepE/Etk N-terminal domain-containing protein [Patulibacter defluvii]|uniref:Wzz/FepE/Etk N-terminal domain-containing protein n=1 Tax=Patulibacter defluvii TaxID=3095358 RepID=UPI002A7524EC|nr:Wzz/FepE/Etk N-terminal domain-containing protein [Patulibacter sp. DM4]